MFVCKESIVLTLNCREVDRKMSISVSGVWSQVKLVVLDNLASPFMPYVGNPSLRTGFTIASHLSQLLHQLAITRWVASFGYHGDGGPY